MIFCRIEHDDYGPYMGDGLDAEMAFSNAKNSVESNNEFGVTSECRITFWEATKLNIQVRFVPTFTYI